MYNFGCYIKEAIEFFVYTLYNNRVLSKAFDWTNLDTTVRKLFNFFVHENCYNPTLDFIQILHAVVGCKNYKLCNALRFEIVGPTIKKLLTIVYKKTKFKTALYSNSTYGRKLH